MNFKVKVNSNIEFNISQEDLLKLDAIKISESKYHILHDNKSFHSEITHTDINSKSYEVTVNKNHYSVNIFNALDLLIKDLGFSIGTSKHINFIKAPMPGLILEINVKPGQIVHENETLLILEAMKMENVLTSPRDGVVKSISTKKGDTVDKGTLLIEFEK
ncbi:MAG: acetyl-CoA carboxylase biotin carboxyl carrier protein subunit [Flavobacteriales bacterium]|nr:acetyl-CoA carboxylase biotin carboxyl carrier protein subunit [Flavobacteriia bacterium]NCP06166.1 acetyl-CoA carboxylase biotin carboxyl carrier protein subunit [Flavobacteriales bacterium]PIV94156.1 MAG: acetyl-CoA carboxylase biotin carboxyl carrier protein subunit [Flavobacteriaceae bacterium CG17_big_fil_post_rev_8_21_14_2_50_33_15]PIY09595.1 MAG: acetyl-CoA carboxylase biotin carboxyl carrier protein subunit [Flavobacteriaceae bacterium CG_4_10_14_3_um_filter_33_47]PJB17374.1 MAG: ace